MKNKEREASPVRKAFECWAMVYFSSMDLVFNEEENFYLCTTTMNFYNCFVAGAFHSSVPVVQMESVDAKHDIDYANGFFAGWNAGVDEDNEKLESVRRMHQEGRAFMAAPAVEAPTKDYGIHDYCCPICGEDIAINNGFLRCRGNFNGKCRMKVKMPKLDILQIIIDNFSLDDTKTKMAKEICNVMGWAYRNDCNGEKSKFIFLANSTADYCIELMESYKKE